jgi:hypothetical protein
LKIAANWRLDEAHLLLACGFYRGVNAVEENVLMKILISNSGSMRRLVQIASLIFAILVIANIHYLVAQQKIAGTNNSAIQMKVDDVDITCTISADKTQYVVGEMPVISVVLHNNEDRKVTLVGSLDGSDAGRFPRCQFKIAAPPGHSQSGYGRCGNTNAIRMADFVDVPAGGKFDPFRRENGFFVSPKLR